MKKFNNSRLSTDSRKLQTLALNAMCECYIVRLLTILKNDIKGELPPIVVRRKHQ